jgi:indole-3-glycerol phosphate synthase
MLHKIVAEKVKEIDALLAGTALRDMERSIAGLPDTISMKKRFSQRKRPVGVIAEVKKASPSKGIIREDFSPVDIAKEYGRADVEAISVLTDSPFFQGKLAYLKEIKNRIENPIPLLRKDFHLHPAQLYEARYYGADAVLLIAAILEREKLQEMAREARALGLEVLVEVHTEEELDLVLSAIEPDLLGINNRDLATFTTSLSTTLKLVERIPPSLITISESGISSADDIAVLEQAHIDGVLVGEHFMRQQSIAEAVKSLVGPAVQQPKDIGV